MIAQWKFPKPEERELIIHLHNLCT